MESRWLLVLAVEVGTIIMSIIGATVLWQMANDERVAAPLRYTAEIAGILILMCGAVAAISLVYTLGCECRTKLHRYQSRRSNDKLNKESSELLFQAGLDPAEPEFLK